MENIIIIHSGEDNINKIVSIKDHTLINNKISYALVLHKNELIRLLNIKSYIRFDSNTFIMGHLEIKFIETKNIYQFLEEIDKIIK